MEGLVFLGVLGIVAWAASRLARSGNAAPVAAPLSDPEPEPEPLPASPEDLVRRACALAAQLEPAYQAAAVPGEILDHPLFEEAVALLCRPEIEAARLVALYHGDLLMPACVAVEALARREGDPDVRDTIISGLNTYGKWTRYFALRLLVRRSPASEPLIARVLVRLSPEWREPHFRHFLGEFIAARLAAGETPRLEDPVPELQADQVNWLADVLAGQNDERLQPLVVQLRGMPDAQSHDDVLRQVGRVWTARETGVPVFEHPALAAAAARCRAALLARPARPVLLVGDEGSGRATLARFVASGLSREGWRIFETTHRELLAGMTFYGQLEERVLGLARALSTDRRVLWVAPEFHVLAHAGRTQHTTWSILDLLAPSIEAGALSLLGQATPRGFEGLVRAAPQLRNVFEVIELPALDDATTLALARQLTRAEGDPPPIADALLGEALALVKQYLTERANPGALLDFLKEALRERRECRDAAPLGIDELLGTASRLSGLPASVLDDRLRLDLAAVRAFFEQRIKGQRAAVDCLVERIAMVKAGVTDPDRPLGVFLFAGPTGTGKTQLAKALAEYLFGSPQRMIRIDMSELQSPDMLGRLVGDADVAAGTGVPLVQAIKQQPFSVVLLDEFEKAHPRVWDLFLQLFDDGRLTDSHGNTADFRNAIVILTSNLGGTIPAGVPLGFTDDAGQFNPGAVHRAIERTFRKEFLNRLDRVIVFEPLTRETMREILRRELKLAFQRRGLRRRTWAVEWDDSALEFVLERGFTHDLGARPLRRAIEEHVLAPLATAIVHRDYPQGDQFLFFRADGGRLAVEFVDPDQPESTPAPAAIAIPGDLRVESIALEPAGDPAELALLAERLSALAGVVEGDAWRDRKAASLEALGAPGFWESPGRFAVLGTAEYADRVEVAFDSARKLLDRLEGAKERARIPTDLLHHLAQKVLLIEDACADLDEGRATDAFVLVQSGEPRDDEAAAFARRIGAMYRQWAERRGMKHVLLDEAHDLAGYRVLLAASGFGALRRLEPEDGLHVWEAPAAKGPGHVRVPVRVHVRPQPAEPARGRDALRALGLAAFEGLPATPRVVRRYREQPAPLVRDAVRGWRTGRIDRVLGGDFDLVVGTGAADP